MAFCTKEYRHLLDTEKALSAEIQSPGERSNIAQLARALVDVIRLKRDIRGIPNPRDIDVAVISQHDTRSPVALSKWAPKRVIDVKSDDSAPTCAPSEASTPPPAPVDPSPTGDPA